MANVYSEAYGRFLVRLREARRQANLTREQVGKRLKRPQSLVSKCESGERRVDAVELSVVAKLYRRTVDYFLT